MTMTAAASRHERGSVGFRRLGLAMWCAGMATFVLVYAVQGLLPTLAAQFGVAASTSSLALSATHAHARAGDRPALGGGRVVGSHAGDDRGARGGGASSGWLAPLAPSFGMLVLLRGLQGIALAALPALAMAHVTREVAPRHLGGAVGLLIAGNTIGGLSGRLVATAVADVAGWRVGLLAVGLLSLACTAAFRLLLPPPVAPAAPPVRLRALGGQVVRHLRDPGLACLFGLAFVLMGAFVTVYNYLGFRLLGAPFDLPPALVALIFLGYLAGSWASTTAGRLGDRFGRRTVLWIGLVVALAGIAVTAPAWLPTVLAGPGAAHGRLLRGAFAGQRLGRPPVGQPARRIARGGGVALPVLLLRGQQHRRHGRRPGVRPPGLARRRRVRRACSSSRGSRSRWGCAGCPRVTTEQPEERAGAGRGGLRPPVHQADRVPGPGSGGPAA